ncbi:MAG: alpha-L-rhamnosidase N-terminal domain-containing protein, partial [Devosia sp.]
MDHAAGTGSLAGEAKPLPLAGEMSAPPTDRGVGTQSSFLRQTFCRPAGGGPVTLRISALGLYRAFINGERVGSDLLTP